MKRKILITGSSGFIARHLIPELLSDGHTVVGLDVKECPTDFGKCFRHVTGDIRTSQDHLGSDEDIDTIIHLAAEHRDFGISPSDYYDVNVGGMRSLLQFASGQGVNDFLFASSVAVYGDAKAPTDEQTPPNPASDYGRSKWQAECILRNWAADVNTRRTISVRPTVVYGEHNRENMYRLIDSIARNRYIQVGEGDNRKSIVYVKNVTCALRYLIDGWGDRETTVNLADCPSETSRDVAEFIAHCLGKRILKLSVPYRMAMMLVSPLDILARITGVNVPITKARIVKYLTATVHKSDLINAMGFVPPFSQNYGIERTVSWYLRGQERQPR